MIGKSTNDACALFRATVIVGVPSAGMRAKVSLSCPAMAMRILCPFLISTDVGSWQTRQYGSDLKGRERGMIEDCDSAIIIWCDSSGVIAENLELLKRLGKPTFLYEYSAKTNSAKAGWLDPERIYDPYYYMKEYYRKQKQHT